MGDVLIGEITITKSSHRPTNGFVGTLFIYAEETTMKKARQIVKPSATLLLINSIGDKYPKHLRGLLLIK